MNTITLERIKDIQVISLVKFIINNDNIEFLSISDTSIQNKLWFWEKNTIRKAIISITTIAALKCWLDFHKKPTMIMCQYPIDFLKICTIYINNEFRTIICQTDYPDRIAFSVLEKDIDILASQNPENVDKLTKVKNQVENIKEIVQNNIEKIILNDEKLEELLIKSEVCNNISEKFYKDTKKMNRCCRIL